jgi:S-adenosylmethionine-diacylglycerol 3-amino-3-carboxypropyl transferase
MEKQLTDRVNFEFIRYANCWEDADILLEGLNPRPNSKILSIASAGDNSFSLLVTNPELVVAVDVNAVQLYLVELKQICIEHFSREQTLEFLGFTESTNRGQLFEILKPYLSEETKHYWEVNFSLIESGLIHQGKFEKYFQLFCKKILPWIHTKKTINELFKPKSEDEQLTFYNKHWNTWRWRLLFKIFFSKRVMGKYGRDPEFLKQVDVKVSDYIFKKAEQQLQSIAAQRNFILQYNLTSSFGENYPHYLRKENYDIVKQNIHRLKIHKGYAEEAIASYGKFDYMNLSNIFEYLDKKTFKTVADALVNGSNGNAKLAYWNLMVPRKIAELFPKTVINQKDISQKLTQQDKGFFYSQFIIDEIRL